MLASVRGRGIPPDGGNGLSTALAHYQSRDTLTDGELTGEED